MPVIWKMKHHCFRDSHLLVLVVLHSMQPYSTKLNLRMNYPWFMWQLTTRLYSSTHHLVSARNPSAPSVSLLAYYPLMCYFRSLSTYLLREQLPAPAHVLQLLLSQSSLSSGCICNHYADRCLPRFIPRLLVWCLGLFTSGNKICYNQVIHHGLGNIRSGIFYLEFG